METLRRSTTYRQASPYPANVQSRNKIPARTPSDTIPESFTIEELPDDMGYDGDIEVQRPSGYEEESENEDDAGIGAHDRKEEPLEKRLSRLSMRKRQRMTSQGLSKSGQRTRSPAVMRHKRNFSESFESESDEIISIIDEDEDGRQAKRRILSSPTEDETSAMGPSAAYADGSLERVMGDQGEPLLPGSTDGSELFERGFVEVEDGMDVDKQHPIVP